MHRCNKWFICCWHRLNQSQKISRVNWFLDDLKQKSAFIGACFCCVIHMVAVSFVFHLSGVSFPITWKSIPSTLQDTLRTTSVPWALRRMSVHTQTHTHQQYIMSRTYIKKCQYCVLSPVYCACHCPLVMHSHSLNIAFINLIGLSSPPASHWPGCCSAMANRPCLPEQGRSLSSGQHSGTTKGEVGLVNGIEAWD